MSAWCVLACASPPSPCADVLLCQSRRHALRVAATGEVPIPVSQAPNSTSREEQLFAKRGYKIDRNVATGTRRQAGYKD